ncbi:MAG: hypothetical protein ABJA78_08165 [Ferruginibacter sp.]
MPLLSKKISPAAMSLVACWLLLQIFLIYHYSIVTNLEAAVYIDIAKYFLANGHYPSGNFIFYSTQIMLDAFCMKTGIGFWPVMLLQIILNGFSIILFYRLINKFSGSKTIAFVYTLAFLAMFYYQLYNVSLYTESIYFSLGIIFTYFLFTCNQISFKNILIIIAGLLLLIVTRPTGIFYFPAAFVFLVIKFYRKKTMIILCCSLLIGFTAFYFLLNFALGSGGALDFLLPNLNETIICGIPTLNPPHQIALNGNHNSVAGLWYFITNYPRIFFPLAGRRLLTFAGIYRNYYSALHNIFACTYFFTAYFLILLSLKKLLSTFFAETMFILTIILLYCAAVAVSCDEWHNRFILGLLPFLLLMSAAFFKKK